jgi:hypothetical protein
MSLKLNLKTTPTRDQRINILHSKMADWIHLLSNDGVCVLKHVTKFNLPHIRTQNDVENSLYV